MWHTYDFGTLFLPTAAIFFITATASLRVTGSFAGAMAASLVKSGLFFVYFSVVFDGTYGLIDDQTYARRGEEFFAKGVGILNLDDHLPLIVATAGGPHFAYYLYNVYAIHLFGHGYFAPVALNVILSAFIAYLGARLAEREFGFSGALRVLFFYYLLLFPDVLVWSSFINDKDILVLFLHVVLLFGFSLWFRNRSISALLLIIPAAFVLFFLRFYVPVLFSAAFVASIFVAGRTNRRFYWLAAGGVLTASVVMMVGAVAIGQAANLLLNDLVNPVFGLLRFLLTPIPLNTETASSFLDVPATIHWILMPFAVFGAYKVYQIGTPFSRFFLIYFATFVAIYSVFGELQGPRHRVQLDFAWAVFQFAGLLALVRDAGRSGAKTAEAGVRSE